MAAEITATEVPNFLSEHISSFRDTIIGREDLYTDDAGIYALIGDLYWHLESLSRQRNSGNDVQNVLTAIEKLLINGSSGVRDCVTIEVLDLLFRDTSLIDRIQERLSPTLRTALDERRVAWSEWRRKNRS